MRNATENKPTHLVKGNIFDALGFSASEASALKVKAELLSAIPGIRKSEGLHASAARARFGRIPAIGEQPPERENLSGEYRETVALR
jgi:hypothetical protein